METAEKILEIEEEKLHTTNKQIISNMQNAQKRELGYIIDISGENAQKKSKAHTFIKYYELYPIDGTERVIMELEFTKPIVKVLHSVGYYHVYLDFGSANDMDLRMTYDLLSRYEKPANSVYWLPEEIESGVYIDEDGKKRKIFYPMVSISLLPIGKETIYQMHGFNPLLFDLIAGDIKGTPSVMHFVFDENTFEILDEKIEFSMNEIRLEAEEELQRELEGRR